VRTWPRAIVSGLLLFASGPGHAKSRSGVLSVSVLVVRLSGGRATSIPQDSQRRPRRGRERARSVLPPLGSLRLEASGVVNETATTP